MACVSQCPLVYWCARSGWQLGAGHVRVADRVPRGRGRHGHLERDRLEHLRQRAWHCAPLAAQAPLRLDLPRHLGTHHRLQLRCACTRSPAPNEK